MGQKVSYEVRVMGQLGPSAGQAFAEMSTAVTPPFIVLRGDLDQASLYVMLERIEALGWELVGLRRV